MFRDTLEMIPVAIIMTLILSFGVRTGRIPSVSRSSASIVQQGPSIPAIRPAPPTSADVTPAAEKPETVETRNAATIPEELPPPRLFFEKAPQRSDVPFYTSRDLEAFKRRTQRSMEDWRVSGGQSAASVTGAVSPVPRSSNAATPSTASNATRQVAVNRANLHELQRIPGIGPVKAQALLDRRPEGGYRTWQEIDQVPGFGAGMITTMKRHATLE